MRSLRGRLFGLLALAALVSSALTVVVALALSRRAAEGAVRDGIVRQADAIASTLALEGARPRPRPRVFLVGPRGGVSEPAGRPGATRGARSRVRRLRARVEGARDGAEGTLELPAITLRYLVRDTPAGRIVVARAAAPAAGEVRPVGGILLVAGLGGTLLAAGAAALVSGRVGRPLRELEAAAGALAAGRADVRLEPRGPDEVASLAASFNAMADDLAAARDAERRFLLSVSHELRTPLTVVKGYAEALEDEAVPSADAAATIRREAARLERLVGDLLDLARLGRREWTATSERVDLAEVARAARDRHLADAERAGVALEVTSTTPAPAAQGDFDRLVQAASNLVDNALRVTPPGGRVELAAAPGRLEVADTGPGLAPEDLERAFEPFHLHRRLGPERAGASGLGLAIVAQLAQAMGGRARAEATDAGGTRFVLELSSSASPP